MYHITKKDYLESILDNGLLVNSGHGGFLKKRDINLYYLNYGMQPIFLTKDYFYTIQENLTATFLKESAILKIYSKNLKLEEEFKYMQEKWNLFYDSKKAMQKNLARINRNITYISKNNIPKELITVYKIF